VLDFLFDLSTSSDVQIIYRGTRSLGYGFVTFATCEEAEKAVAATDKTEIDGRAINVEIAKPAPVSSQHCSH
jgi:RNA recognition motif-containing protein